MSLTAQEIYTALISRCKHRAKNTLVLTNQTIGNKIYHKVYQYYDVFSGIQYTFSAHQKIIQIKKVR